MTSSWIYAIFRKKEETPGNQQSMDNISIRTPGSPNVYFSIDGSSIGEFSSYNRIHSGEMTAPTGIYLHTESSNGGTSSLNGRYLHTASSNEGTASPNDRYLHTASSNGETASPHSTYLHTASSNSGGTSLESGAPVYDRLNESEMNGGYSYARQWC